MSRRRAHIRVVVFHTLHRGQRDTRLCPYLVYCATLSQLQLPHIQGSSVLIPLLYYSRPSFSASSPAADVSFSPSTSIHACYHHRIPTLASLLSLRRLTEVQKQSYINILRDQILTSPNVSLLWIKPRLRSRRLRQGILPLPI